MVNRIADRLLNAVLPRTKAAAPCGPLQYRLCYCSGTTGVYKTCRECTGQAPPCSACNIRLRHAC